MTTSLNVALALKAQSPVPASVVLVKGNFEVVSMLSTMTEAQRAGLYVAWEWHRAFGRSGEDATFHPIQFEIYGIKPKGRYWLSPSGLKLVQSVDSVTLENNHA